MLLPYLILFTSIFVVSLSNGSSTLKTDKCNEDRYFHGEENINSDHIEVGFESELTGYTIELRKAVIIENNFLFCEFFLKNSDGSMIEKAHDPKDEMKIKHDTADYGYSQDQMKLDVAKNKRCDPDLITTLQEKNADYHYIDVESEDINVKCMDPKYELIAFHSTESGWNKPQKVTSIECKEESSNNWKYKITRSSGDPLFIVTPNKFNAACKTKDKLCRLCKKQEEFLCNTSHECPVFTEGKPDSACHKFECPKMINTPLGTFPKGAQCTPPEGTTTTFTWKIGGSPAVSGNCVDYNCQDQKPLNIVCEFEECKDIDKEKRKTEFKCPPGLNLIAMDGSSSVGISLECNHSTGEWIRSDGKTLPFNNTLHCKKESEEETTIDDESSAQKQAGPDMLVISLAIGGGLIVLMICLVALWCVCIRGKKKKTPPPSVPPPSVPTSQPSTDKAPPSSIQPQSSSSSPYGRQSPAAPSPLPPPSPSRPPPPPPVQKIVVVVKREEDEEKKKTIKMESINIKGGVQDEKSLAALSQTGEKLSERTIEKSRIEKTNGDNEQSKTAGTTREQNNTQSDVQKKSKSVMKSVEDKKRQKTEEDSKSFDEAYNKELEKIGKKKK